MLIPRRVSACSRWLLPLLALISFLLWGVHAQYPLLGHDFGYHLGHLLAGRWHVWRQGFLPFRFSPHFCGGMPIHGNPQAMFYSLQQLLALVLDPWLAIILSIIAMLLAGYAGWRLVGRDIFRLPDPYAHLLALIVSAHGFFLLHMAVGHLVYLTVPLVGWFLWLLFDPHRETRATLLVRSCCFALLMGVVLYSGGYLTVLFTLFACLLMLPCDIALHWPHCGERVRTLAVRTLLGGSLALLLTLSDLVAITSLMRQFPRTMPFDRFAEDASTLGFMARSLFLLPQHPTLYDGLGVPLGVHELSMFLSPVVPAGLGGLLVVALRGRWWRVLRLPAMGMLLGALLLLTFFTQLVRGYGILVTPLQDLPVFSSIHATVRFLYPLSLLVAACGLVGFFLFIRSGHPWMPSERTLLLVASWGTILALIIAYGGILADPDQLRRNVHYDRIRVQIAERGWLSQPVMHARWGGTFSFHVLQGTTGCIATNLSLDIEVNIR